MCSQLSTINEASDLRELLARDADQINHRVRIPHRFLEALGPVVDHRVCAEVAHEGNIIFPP